MQARDHDPELGEMKNVWQWKNAMEHDSRPVEKVPQHTSCSRDAAEYNKRGEISREEHLLAALLGERYEERYWESQQSRSF